MLPSRSGVLRMASRGGCPPGAWCGLLPVTRLRVWLATGFCEVEPAGWGLFGVCGAGGGQEADADGHTMLSLLSLVFSDGLPHSPTSHVSASGCGQTGDCDHGAERDRERGSVCGLVLGVICAQCPPAEPVGP